MSQRKQQDMGDGPLRGGPQTLPEDGMGRRRRLPSIRSPKLWIVLTLLLVLVAGVVVGGRLLYRPPAKPSAASSLTTTSVARKDLAQRQRVDGTLEFEGSNTVSSQYAAPPSDATLTSLQHELDAARTAYDNAVKQANLKNQLSAEAVAAAESKLSYDKQQLASCKMNCEALQQTVTTDESQLSKDKAQQKMDKLSGQQAVDTARAALTKAQDKLNDPSSGGGSGSGGGGTVYITWLPPVGTVVDRGKTMFRLNGQPIPLFFGDEPFSRTLKPGVSGHDVQELEDNLLALGYNDNGKLTSDGNFSSVDSDAVSQWQKDLGVKVTGVVNAGDVVILPGPARVNKLANNVFVGATIATGGQILTATSTTPVVTVKLKASLQTVVKEGDPVEVVLPNQKSARGKITSKSKVAQSDSSSSSSTSSSPTVSLTIKLDDASGTGNLDQASVTVDIIPGSTTVKGALAVPISALVAQQGGGYALEVLNPNGRTHFVPVQTGVYDDLASLVQVTGTGISEGTRIVIPAT